MSRVAVIDFETTGLSPDLGDRATEVAVVILEAGQAVDRYASLMNAGVRIPAFITELTGITNAMVKAAPRAATVMADVARFVGATPMVAHNASFDRRFWTAELHRAGILSTNRFACTMLLARRLYPQAPNHKLGTLIDLHRLPRPGAAHRALADAEMAASLWGRMLADLRHEHGVPGPDHALLMRLQVCSRAGVPAFLARRASAGT